ncbi:xyloglucan galactosyltransferase KATAMARI1 homolog [Aristolochia californica]|uniref:xyloglucan galactosyltransferase KATAMARI1 homolog n=1 Tax=Aristolochia californica TaxID=171875 RepID=UPI0035DA3984
MEKLNGKCRSHFCFVVLSVSLFWFFFYYSHSSTLARSIQSIVPYSYVIASSRVDSLPPESIGPRTLARSPNDAGKKSFRSAAPNGGPESCTPQTAQLGKNDVCLQESMNRASAAEDHEVENSNSGPKKPIKDRNPVRANGDAGGVRTHDQLPVTNQTVDDLRVSEKRSVKLRRESCSGRYIYVHRLPNRFNMDMLKQCQTLSIWTDMCRFTSNGGLGPMLRDKDRVFSKKGWYATDQFSLDVIFNRRMRQYRCLTDNSSEASAIFVPFFAGLDVARYLWGYNVSVRDSAALDLMNWLAARPEWKKMGGRDHFLVAGRIAWDFRRLTDEESDWGSKLLLLPEARNMTILVIESNPWSNNDYSIPYPTYFHPSKDSEVFSWQSRMRKLNRPWLFSFAGAPRPNMTASIRNNLIRHCQASRRCWFLDCDTWKDECRTPSNVMKMFQRSIFCLQPPGDSYTRRSTFDSMLAGCIPVFFHPGSAYVQYRWHLPKNHSNYSVFIPEREVRQGKTSIERTLLEIPEERVRTMRETVIGLIPRLIYADPRSRLGKLEDAFDIAVRGVIENVNKVRKGRRKSGPTEDFTEEQRKWKNDLMGIEEDDEWDSYFTAPDTAERYLSL